MALLKMNFYLVLLLLFVGIPVGLGLVGESLALDDNIILNQRSEDFISTFSESIESQNLELATLQNNAALKEDNIITGDEGATEDFKDNFMANLNFYRIKIGKTINYLKLVYNAPTFFLLVLNLPIASWAWFINLMTVILFISLLVLIIREVKG